MKTLRGLIWLFFWLLIFEGALRKWVLPGFSSILLIARDPVALLLYLLALQARVFPANNFVTSLLPLSVLCFLTALVFGHGDPVVAVYGVRTDFLFIPFLFLVPRLFDREDVMALGRVLLMLSIPMTALLVMQFFSPQGAWVNRSVMGAEGGGFAGAMGRFRPPGTFSFITGVACFYTLAAAFFMAHLFDRRRQPLWLMVGSGLAIIAAIPLSISRLLAVSVAVVLLGCVVPAFREAGRSAALVRGAGLLGVLVVAVQFLPFFAPASEAFTMRWIEATEGGGGIQKAIFDRALSDYTGPIEALLDVPPMGDGIGLGTNVGARLATGRMGFLLGEGEWYRILGELGAILGFCYIVMRVALTLHLFQVSWACLKRGNYLPYVIFLAVGVWVLSGQWGPPTNLGFAVLGGGLCLAGARERRRVVVGGEARGARSILRPRMRGGVGLAGARGRSPGGATI